jgi:hypothetical protein
MTRSGWASGPVWVMIEVEGVESMRGARSGFVVAGIGVVVAALMATTQAGASRPVLDELTPPAPVVSAAAVSVGDDDDDATSGESGDHGRADQNDTHCAGSRKACGIKGHYVCCDFEAECCTRKHRRTVCAQKSDRACQSSKPTPPVPVPVPRP